jgi:hypothetical protein
MKVNELIASCGIQEVNVIPIPPTPVASDAGFNRLNGTSAFLVAIPKINGFSAKSMDIWVGYKGKDTSGCLDQFDKTNLQNEANWKSSHPAGKILTDDVTVLCFFTSPGEINLRINAKFCDPSCGLPWPSFAQSEFIKLPIPASQASTPSPTPITTPIPAPSVQGQIVTPGAFCSPAGAIGKSTSGVSYTCKTSSTDARNRWRQ